MAKKHLEESEITSEIKYYSAMESEFEYRPKDFIAYKVDAKWRIAFTYFKNTGCELHLKRKGIKTFSDLSSVENCLRKIGIAEFKVVLKP